MEPIESYRKKATAFDLKGEEGDGADRIDKRRRASGTKWSWLYWMRQQTIRKNLKMEMNLVLDAHWRGHGAGKASTYLQDGQHSCR